jgi:hypothetical protein
MQMMTVTAVVAMLVMSHSSSAKSRDTPEAWSPKAAASQPYTAEESATLARAARAKAEAQERVWDRKMKGIANGICTGC